MKKIQFLINLMCVFVLGFITQAKAETLDSFLPEKTGIENHTVQSFVDYWSAKSDEELLYYVGAQFVWSAKNTRASSTESVYDKMKQSGYDYVFGDPAMIRDWINYLERGFEPLTGQVKTAGISSSKAIQPLTRNAYANELALTFDWNIVEEMSDPEFPLILGTDVDAVNIFSAKCGNPLYPPRVGGGYARVNRTGSTVSTAPPGGFQKQTEEQVAPVNNYYETNNNYYEQETVQRESYDQGYGYSEPRVGVSLSFHGGWLWGNQCCGFGGYGAGYCNHHVPYQTFGYQPYGGGQPNITNPNIYVNVVNNNTNTNTNTNTTTVTNTNNPGNPPGPGGGNPNNPPDPHGPKDPINGGRGNVSSGGGTNYANATQSRPKTSQSSGNQVDQSTQGRPKSGSQVGNNSSSYSQSSGQSQNQSRGNNVSRPVKQRPVQNQQFLRPAQQKSFGTKSQMAYNSSGGQSRSARR
jgi:hypothetical protein